MAVFKCKMCGGNLEAVENATVCECEYCGTQQTIPKNHDDVVANLFNRANNLRIKSDFDKAQEIYEKIVGSNPNEAEAYWGIILCKYGIEYVEDPATFTKIPTCHRTQLESVRSDPDFLSAIEHADAVQKGIYEKEAEAIDKLQKNILAIVHNEEPFDVFICYKETDESGKRTPDSVIANDIYHQLTNEGFKVFYAAITLEDKLGQAYEPYIFAALNSARVMLSIGTRPEYFTAVWVKNEWSRFLKIMKNDRSKLLIPCYKDMDAYDLPGEFSYLQAQDMSKIGFINDVIRGIKKVIAKDEPKPAVQQDTTVIESTPAATSSTAPLLKRAFMFLEDKEWESADEYCEKVLDIDPECGQAYLGKLMCEYKIYTVDGFKNCKLPFYESKNYSKALKYCSEELTAKLKIYAEDCAYTAADLFDFSELRHNNMKKDSADYQQIYSLFATINNKYSMKDFLNHFAEYSQKYPNRIIMSNKHNSWISIYNRIKELLLPDEQLIVFWDYGILSKGKKGVFISDKRAYFISKNKVNFLNYNEITTIKRGPIGGLFINNEYQLAGIGLELDNENDMVGKFLGFIFYRVKECNEKGFKIKFHDPII